MMKMRESASRIFVPYRSYGYISNHLPLVVRYIERRKENLVVTVVGKSFLTYQCQKLRLLSISNPLLDEICCIAADSYLVYTASNCVINTWVQGTKIKHTLNGHKKPVHLLYPFGPHLISVDEDSNVNVWETNSEELFLNLKFNNENFRVTTILHPSTLKYENKLLLGSQQGEMQLWDIKSGKQIHAYKGWNHSVTVLEDSPAVDVIAVGLANGEIIIFNLKCEKIIVKFMQDWGPVTSLSFRKDMSKDEMMLASGSTLGHIAIWDLVKKRLHSQLRQAHHSSVVGINFLSGEPLMVTNSADNSLKVWIFDMSDASARLLHSKEGHSSPPTKVEFYGSSGETILSAGEDSSLRIFSTANDLLHKSLGRARKRKKSNKKKVVSVIAEELSILPPVIDFATEATREKDWDNIVACHQESNVVTTWSYHNCKMGKFKLKHKNKFGNTEANIAKCVTISPCGNFVLIGFQSGHIDKFNLQSGEFRGSYGKEKAHEGSLCGLAVDGLNQIVISVGMDKKINFWKFKSCDLFFTLKMDRTVNKCRLHRESSLLAMAVDDFTLQILDVDTKRIVRKFDGCDARITDFDFSGDARWIVAASLDCTIRTWDIPSARMIDCFLVEHVCTSLSMSPTGEYLITSHVDKLEVCAWINQTLFTFVQLSPLPSDFEPSLHSLPERQIHISMDVETTSYEDAKFKTSTQISDDLVTLSLLPESQWKNLLLLDILKKRNKPKEPLQMPKKAPFFLPTTSKLEFQFGIPNETKKTDTLITGSRLLNDIVFQTRTAFGKQLEASNSVIEYEKCMETLKTMGQTAYELEILALGPENGGSVLLLSKFMKMLQKVMETNRNFEIAQSVFGLFLKTHRRLISTESSLIEGIQFLQKYQVESWDRIQGIFLSCQSVISFLKSAPL